jgi:hypothetical protein
LPEAYQVINEIFIEVCFVRANCHTYLLGCSITCAALTRRSLSVSDMAVASALAPVTSISSLAQVRDLLTQLVQEVSQNGVW